MLSAEKKSDAVNQSLCHLWFYRVLPERGLDLPKHEKHNQTQYVLTDLIRLSLCFLTPTRSTVLWGMLCPFLTNLYFLCLDVSVSIVLITLNVCLTGNII